MATRIKAAEAAAESERRARGLEAKRRRDERDAELRRKQKARAANRKFLDDLRRDVRMYIDAAVEGGRREARYTLSSGDRALCGEAAWMKGSGHGRQLRTLLRELAADGYKTAVEGVSTEHDDSAAYLNSGGECGSEEPYWTQDTVLKVAW